MKRLLSILLLSSIWLSSFGQAPDRVITNPVPLTGTQKNTQSDRYANITATKRFFIPKFSSNSAFLSAGGKDSTSFYFNTSINRIVISRQGGGFDTLATSASVPDLPDGITQAGNITVNSTTFLATINPVFKYRLNNILVTTNYSPSNTVQLDVPDPTNSRIDIIYGNTDGSYGKVTGLAANTQIVPETPINTILLATVLVYGANTNPIEVAIQPIGGYYKTTGGEISGSPIITDGFDIISRARQGSLDAGDWVLQAGDGTEIGRIWKHVGLDRYQVRFGLANPDYTILHSGQIDNGLIYDSTTDKLSINTSIISDTTASPFRTKANSLTLAQTQTKINLKENLSNKQNSLNVDGTGVKYPTVDAVNSGLLLKSDTTKTNFSGVSQTLLTAFPTRGFKYVTPRVVATLLDSETDGAGGSNYRKYFVQHLRKTFGDGGPGWIAFDNAAIVNDGNSWGFSISGKTDITIGSTFGKMSWDGKGLYTNTGGGAGNYINLTPAAGWSTARIYYLKQSGGGTFKYGTVDILDASLPTADTDSAAYSIGYVDVPLGAGTSGRILKISVITGKVCLFGAMFTNNSTGVLMANIAQGGRTTKQVFEQDSTFQVKWYAMMKPSHILFNGGVNDRIVTNGTTFNSYLTEIVSRMQTGFANSNIVLISPNETVDFNSTFLKDYPEQRIRVAKTKNLGYIDIPNQILGNYTKAVSMSYMLGDGIHPTDLGYRTIAMGQYRLLSPTFQIQSATSYAGGGGSPPTRYLDTLSNKTNLSVNVGDSLLIYDLGLGGGFPVANISFHVYSNINSFSRNNHKSYEITATNSTIINRITSVNTFVVTQYAKNSLADDFLVVNYIQSNRLKLYIKPLVTNQNFLISDGKIRLPYNTTSTTVI